MTRTVKLEELAITVAAMRAAQKNYFKTRDRALLERSKGLERMVDKALVDLATPGFL